MSQNPLTVAVHIVPNRVADLEALLEMIGNDITGKGANNYLRFSDLKTVHFCCWVVLRSTADSANPANVYPDTLVLETNFDGDLNAHLNELVTTGAKALDAVYSHCEGWPAAGCADRQSALIYLTDHAVPTSAYYIGCPDHTVADVDNALGLRMELETYLDSNPPAAGTAPANVLADIRNYLTSAASVKPVPSPETLEAQGKRSLRNVIFTALIGLPIILAFSPLILIYYIALRIHEADDAKLVQAALPVDPRLFGKEDIFIQNHLTTLVDVKPGKFRLYTLKFVLWLISILAKTVFITGQLGGIPTIHFARWCFLEDDRRLLFFSNYDGSWASYLGDFVDKANYGLTAVWSNTDRFPPSNSLAFGGAQHIEAFKAWSRQHNVYAAVWYSAYPDETLQNLKNDIQIRDTIMRTDLSDADAKALLGRL